MNHCPTIHHHVGVSPLWCRSSLGSIQNVFLDSPVKHEFQVGVLSVVWFPVLLHHTTRWGHIDRCDRSNPVVGSIRRLPHQMAHTMVVWILKESRTH